MIARFLQGESQIIEIPIIEDGQAVDLSSATNIRVLVKIGAEIYARYGLNSEVGFDGLCSVDPLVNNKIVVPIERETSKTFPVGLARAVVLVEFPNAAFPSGSETREYTINVAHVGEGLGKNENP